MPEEAHKSWPDNTDGVFHKSMEFVAHAHPWTAQRRPDEPELGQSHIQLSELIADKCFQLVEGAECREVFVLFLFI